MPQNTHSFSIGTAFAADNRRDPDNQCVMPPKDPIHVPAPVQRGGNSIYVNLGILAVGAVLATFIWGVLSPVVRMQVKVEQHEKDISQVRADAAATGERVNNLGNRFELFRESMGKDMDTLRLESGRLGIKVDGMVSGLRDIDTMIRNLDAKFENYQVSMDAQLERLKDQPAQTR